MAEQNINQSKEQFDEAQLKALEGIVANVEANPSKVLEEAKNIGLITDTVKEKIEKDLGESSPGVFKHVELFSGVFAKETKKSGVDKATAFKRAFEIVYGKFLLEHSGMVTEIQQNPDGTTKNVEVDLAADDGYLMPYLTNALKFPIDPKFGFKGRSELMASVRRLAEYGVAGGIGEAKNRAEIKKKTDAAKKDLDDGKIKLAAELKELSVKISANEEFINLLKTTRVDYAAIAPSKSKEKGDLVKDAIDEIVANAHVSADLKVMCASYLSDYAVLKTDQEIRNFLVKEAGQFFAKLMKKLDETLVSLRKEPAKIQDKEAKLLKGFEAACAVTPITLVLEKSFPKVNSGADMKGFERVHEEAVGKQKQVKDTYEYFAHHHNLEVFLESHNSFDKIVDGGKAKLGTGEGFYAKRAEAKRNFEVTDKALKDLYEPGESSIERTLESIAKRKRASSEKFDETIERKKIKDDYAANKIKYTREIVVYEEEKDVYENIFEHAAKLHAETKKLVQNLEAAQKLGIPFEAGFDAKALVEDFKKYEPKSRSFNPIEFLAYSEKLRSYFGDHHKVENLQKAFDAKLADSEKGVKGAKKALDKEQAKVDSGKNLTDAQVAKKIVGTMVAEQFPDMPIEEQAKLCTLILADDVVKIQTSESYESLAQRGSADVLDTVKKAGELKIRGRLIGFQYKEGGNVVTPFKGLKPENFNDWASIEKMFTPPLEKLNYKNGFFLLAALEIFDQENGGVPSIQTRRTQDKLKMLLAKRLGVHERMDVAGVSKIVNDAFKAQIEKTRPLVKAHFDLHDSKKGGEAKDYKRQVLNMKYEELTDQLRNGKINSEIFELKVKSLVKEATEADIDDVDFSQDTALAGFWHSKESQWLRDKGVDAAKFVGKKALGVAVVAPLKIAGKGLWGATKLGAGLGYQAAALPFRMAKYPLLLGAKPIVGAINLFRKAPITPLPGIRDSIKNDVGRVLGYASTKTKENVAGAKTAVSGTTAAEWNGVKFTHEKYADRTKDAAALRAEKLKLYGEKSSLEAVETEVSPFIDLAEYKGKIEELDKLLGTKTHFPADTAKAGHTEAAGHKKEESHAPAAANDDHAKHDDHGHDKAHGAHP